MVPSEIVFTPLGFATCVILLVLSLLWRSQSNKRSILPQVHDEKQKGTAI